MYFSGISVQDAIEIEQAVADLNVDPKWPAQKNNRPVSLLNVFHDSPGINAPYS